MAAQEAGVDIGDETAMHAFMAEFNLRQMARLTSAPWPGDGAPTAKAQEPWPKVGPYEPCPCGSGRKYKFCCKQTAQ